ncbi:unnamed protein product, partial [Ectocarpus sp. 8 AP-2014]
LLLLLLLLLCTPDVSLPVHEQLLSHSLHLCLSHAVLQTQPAGGSKGVDSCATAVLLCRSFPRGKRGANPLLRLMTSPPPSNAITTRSRPLRRRHQTDRHTALARCGVVSLSFSLSLSPSLPLLSSARAQ